MTKYLIPLLILGMLAYMAILLARLRRERVRNERESTRGRHAFRPKDRARYLLSRAFKVRDDEPPWEAELRSTLDEITTQPAERTDGTGPYSAADPKA